MIDFIDRTFNEIAAGVKHQEQGRNEVRARRIQIVLCLSCAFGILVFYLLFGILQEDITKDGYGEGYPDGPDYWVFMITLVWVRLEAQYRLIVVSTLIQLISLDHYNDEHYYIESCFVIFRKALQLHQNGKTVP